MADAFIRQGELTDIASYPDWAQEMVAACSAARQAVASHEFFQRMREARLEAPQIRAFLVSGWSVVEQFPQYMALNLLKVHYGRTRGHDLARRFLIRNIRVEQNHADHWIEWAAASGVSRDELFEGDVPLETQALSHWCWHICERDALAAAMAATNYAIEGVTGEWSAFICSSDAYEKGFAPAQRAKAMKWLRLHARYDDNHPWEALEIVCTIMGNDPTRRGVALVRANLQKSYDHMRLGLDHCLAARRGGARPQARVALVSQRA